ncbi:hypothetical protein B0H19DRAFT_1258476 [Mycena capillaripes]|nr:hypothetical protein B0H19DRAFT_1258476 [Mycena capillaripes]
MTVEQTLDTLLQDDPNLPSLPYQAYENVPIHIVWTRTPVQLATGFDSTLATRPDMNPLQNTPFVFKQSEKGAAPYQFSAYEANTSFRSTASSQGGSSYEHLELKGIVSVGGSFLGASGQAAFCRDVFNNHDANKVSVHSTQRVGIIKLAEQPEFTAHARTLLYDPRTRHSFRTAYGDYFVAGLCLGADNATLLSSSSGKDVRSEMKDIKVQAKLLGFTKTIYDKRTDEHSDERSFDIKYSGLDTLRDYQETTQAADERGYEVVKVRAVQSVADGQGLMARVHGVMDELHLVEGATLTSDQLTEVCRSGLVVELLLMPYGGLKEYAEITARFVPAAQSVREPKPAVKPKPGAKPAAKPAAKTPLKPAAKPVAEAAVMSTAKPAAKPVAKPVTSQVQNRHKEWVSREAICLYKGMCTFEQDVCCMPKIKNGIPGGGVTFFSFDDD